MDDTKRTALEHAAMEGCTLEEDPQWHFLFIENAAVLQQMMELFPEQLREPGITDAVLAFSARSAVAAADAGAALCRMYEASSADCAFSEAFTVFFSQKQAEALKEALGVPAGFVCAGALVFPKQNTQQHGNPPRWDVFSYMK